MSWYYHESISAHDNRFNHLESAGTCQIQSKCVQIQLHVLLTTNSDRYPSQLCHPFFLCVSPDSCLLASFPPSQLALHWEGLRFPRGKHGYSYGSLHVPHAEFQIYKFTQQFSVHSSPLSHHFSLLLSVSLLPISSPISEHKLSIITLINTMEFAQWPQWPCLDIVLRKWLKVKEMHLPKPNHHIY